MAAAAAKITAEKKAAEKLAKADPKALLKTCCVSSGHFELDLGLIPSLDDEFESGFVQLAIIIPGEARSANASGNIKLRSTMIQQYLQETLYPKLRSATECNTSSAVRPICFSNAVFLFVNYWPKSSETLKSLDCSEQDTFLLHEKNIQDSNIFTGSATEKRENSEGLQPKRSENENL